MANDPTIKTAIEIALKGKENGPEAIKILRQLETEARKTRKSLGDLGGQAKGLKGPLDQLAAGARAVKAAFASIGIGLGLAALAAFLKTAISGFAQEERALNAVRFQIKALGGDVEGNTAKVEKFIASLSEQSGILDDDLIPAFNRALLVLDDVAQAQEAVALAARFAANGIGDVQGNVEKLTSAFQTGNLKSLREFGIQTKDASGNTITLAEGDQAGERAGRLSPRETQRRAGQVGWRSSVSGTT